MKPRVMLRFLLVLAVSLAALAGVVEGRVTDGSQGLPGVRVYPDRVVRVRPKDGPPVALTDAEGRFKLEIGEPDSVLVVEKSGWQRDLVPLAELARPVVLHPAPQHRVEKVLVVRLDFPDERSKLSDEELRGILFHRQPGEASAASYLYEVSKGSLELEEGSILHLTDPDHASPRTDAHLGALARWVLTRLHGRDLRSFDGLDNRTGALKPDGKPDHLWIVPPGDPQTLSHNPGHFTPTTLLEPLPWNRTGNWPVVLFPEESPLGNIVHEAFHAMGEHRVDDLYLDAGHPDTAGIWDLMDVGMYRGWDRSHPQEGPWQQDTGYSPSQPMGWVRAELWYHGRFREAVTTLKVTGRQWTGWLDPLERAPRDLPQRLLISDPRGRGRFWEFNVRRPWGFDRGRVGNRWGPGFEGLVVARIDPSKLSHEDPKGPVHVIDAHPGTPEPSGPRFFPNKRWQLDDAAFNLGPGEVPKGTDGPLTWEVLEVDAAGRMRLRIELRGKVLHRRR